jgi:hypothetical protein
MENFHHHWHLVESAVPIDPRMNVREPWIVVRGGQQVRAQASPGRELSQFEIVDRQEDAIMGGNHQQSSQQTQESPQQTQRSPSRTQLSLPRTQQGQGQLPTKRGRGRPRTADTGTVPDVPHDMTGVLEF